MKIQRLVYEVQEAFVEVPRLANHSYLITATGIVPCQHWVNPALIESTDLAPPTDGIYEFTLVAEPRCPSSHSSTQLTPLKIRYELNGRRPGFRGIRIKLLRTCA